MKLHPSISRARVINACKRRRFSLDNPGFCIACGVEADGCEPDARDYECAACGKQAVFGCEELLLEF